jgi:EAL domain-containing protein (putative c-di-GMP-specific phosphodiesterase class I)
MVAALREKTGLQRSEFSLTIIPDTKVSGSISGIPINDEFSPTLNFKFNEVGFWMVSAGSSDGSPSDPLNPTAERMVRNLVEISETMAFLGLSLPVSGVRWGSSIMFLLSTGLLGFLMYSTEKMSKSSRSTEIQLRYSPVIVDVQNQPSRQRRTVVEVDTIQDLARLVERFNSVILHEFNPDGTHTYLVQENNTIYQVTFREDIPAPVSSDLASKEAELINALEQEEFELYYQPMIDINSQEVRGVEALLRWNHPTLGILPPSAFIADAEATGLIYQLGEWVLHTACKQLAAWDYAGSSMVSMAINVSSKQLIPQLPRLVKRVLKEFKLKPSRLQLEFSENQILEDLNNNIEIMDSLKKIGVEISIDNYTGQVTIEHLARIQAQNLKFALDVIGQIQNPQVNAITLGTIAAARSLGMAIEAVGVETEEQLWFLRSHLVSSAQGYLFGKPVAADKMLQSLFKFQDNVLIYEKPMMDL